MDIYYELAKWVGWPSVVALLLIIGASIGVLYKLRVDQLNDRIKQLEDELKRTGFSSSQNRTNKSIEKTLYDSKNGIDIFHFEGKPGQYWNDEERRYSGPKGFGKLSVHDGNILNLERTNTDALYWIWLRHYFIDGEVKEYIPKNELISGSRKLLVSYDAKISSTPHTLKVTLKNQKTGDVLGEKVEKITSKEWESIQAPFLCSPLVNCVIRISDEKVDNAPSSVQIRNFLVVEKSTS